MRNPVIDLPPRRALISLALISLAGCAAWAEEPAAPAVPPPSRYNLQASLLGHAGTAMEMAAFAGPAPLTAVDLSLDKESPTPPTENKAGRMWGTGKGRSFLIPALEIPAFLGMLSIYDRHAYPDQMQDGKKVYSATFSSTWDHLIHQHWVIDQDPFAINQFMHPYQGTIFHGFARSAGLNYWEALAYDNMGSFEWKMAGETDPPSINDQIATGIGGSFFGEALFRMSSLLFEDDDKSPSLMRKVAATLIAPTSAFNRYAFGDRFRATFPSGDPAVYSWLQLGAGLQSSQNDQGQRSTVNRNQAMLTFNFAYGLPGKDGYTYTRPFDYFHFEFDALANSGNKIDNVMIRGLLLGTDYSAGTGLDGIWGLYGGYDYISPFLFRVSSTSLSLGTTFQARLGETVTLQGSFSAGGGYGAAGNVTPVGERDYHYGLTPQALAALRLIVAGRVMLDATDRYFYVSGTGSDNPGGNESIHRLNAGLTVRLFGNQAVGFHYIESRRSAHYPGQPDSHQSMGTVALSYTLLGKNGFSTVK